MHSAPVDGLDWVLRTTNRLLQCRSVMTLLDLAYDAIREGLGYDRVGLLLVDRSARTLAAHIGTDATGRKYYPQAHVLPIDGTSYYARLLTDPRMQPDGPGFVYMADAIREISPDVRHYLDGSPRQNLIVALRAADAVRGLISVDNLTSGDALTQDDAPPLVAFANALAIALDNVGLLEERARRIDHLDADLRRRVAELEWLREISERLNAARTLDVVLDIVYDGIREGLGYDRVGIQLIDHARGLCEERRGTDVQGRKLCRADRALPLGEDSPIWTMKGLARVLRGAPYHYSPDVTAATPSAQRYLLDGSPRQCLIVPLRTGETVTGTIAVDNLLSGRPITPDEAGPLLALASHVGTAVENARLLERERDERARLEIMATTDVLTGLPNRALLHDRLEHALHAARRNDTALSLLLLDLDHFKEVNDTLGHPAGDALLREAGLRLRSALRATDTVARLGGDEFAIVLPATDAGGALEVARSLCRALDAPVTIEGQSLVATGSIGVAVYPDHGDDSATLLRCADVAMYAAKRSQAGAVLYIADQDRHAAHHLSLTGALRQALAEESLRVAYQPLVDLGRGAVIGVEALVRWPHPERGVIPPDHFIPLAERTGLIVPLTHLVLRQALRQCFCWQQQSGLPLGVAVNLSANAINDPSLAELVSELLRQYPIAPACLTLELTESALMTDPQRAFAVLTRLAECGIRIAIDDFGTGYSSLGYLKRLPVHEIKIDKSFVLALGATANLKDAAIVRSVVAMGHALGLTVVAEGVETAEAWRLLRKLGCDVAQGYYMSRPLPAPEFERWLDSSDWCIARQESV